MKRENKIALFIFIGFLFCFFIMPHFIPHIMDNYFREYISHFPNQTDIPAPPSGHIPSITFSELIILIVDILAVFIPIFLFFKLLTVVKSFIKRREVNEMGNVRCLDCEYLQVERGSWRFHCPQINDYVPKEHTTCLEPCNFFDEAEVKIWKEPITCA